MIAAWAFLRGIPRQVWLALAVAAALWWAYSWAWNRGYSEAQAEGEAALRGLRAGIELDRAQSEAEARATEARHRAALEAVAARYTEELHDAQARADAVVADLRAGNLRLREHWRGCKNAAARVPAAPTAPAGADAAAELRAAGARDLVRLGAECDAWVRGLQRVIEEGRR